VVVKTEVTSYAMSSFQHFWLLLKFIVYYFSDWKENVKWIV